MILKADPPCCLFYDKVSGLDVVEKVWLEKFIKESKLFLAINLVGLVIIVTAVIWLFLAFQSLFGSVYLMTFSFPLLLAGTFINWKRINKVKEKLRG